MRCSSQARSRACDYTRAACITVQIKTRSHAARAPLARHLRAARLALAHACMALARLARERAASALGRRSRPLSFRSRGPRAPLQSPHAPVEAVVRLQQPLTLPLLRATARLPSALSDPFRFGTTVSGQLWPKMRPQLGELGPDLPRHRHKNRPRQRHRQRSRHRRMRKRKRWRKRWRWRGLALGLRATRARAARVTLVLRSRRAGVALERRSRATDARLARRLPCARVAVARSSRAALARRPRGDPAPLRCHFGASAAARACNKRLVWRRRTSALS